MSCFVSGAVRVYAALLRLCPTELRADFGEEIALVFADDLADSLEYGGPAAAFRVCFHAAAELASLVTANILSIHRVLTSLIASVLTMICFSAELALARAHGPTRISTSPAYVSVAIVLIPSVAAAVVAFIAARLPLRATPQRFLN